MRNIEKKNDKAHVAIYKDCKVFNILLVMQCHDNPQEINYWALVETTTYYAYGVRVLVVY